MYTVTYASNNEKLINVQFTDHNGRIRDSFSLGGSASIHHSHRIRHLTTSSQHSKERRHHNDQT